MSWAILSYAAAAAAYGLLTLILLASREPARQGQRVLVTVIGTTAWGAVTAVVLALPEGAHCPADRRLLEFGEFEDRRVSDVDTAVGCALACIGPRGVAVSVRQDVQRHLTRGGGRAVGDGRLVRCPRLPDPAHDRPPSPCHNGCRTAFHISTIG